MSERESQTFESLDVARRVVSFDAGGSQHFIAHTTRIDRQRERRGRERERDGEREEGGKEERE